MIKLFYLLLVIFYPVPAAAIDVLQVPRVMHYRVEEPKTALRAIYLLENRELVIEQAIAKNDIEAVHEATYHITAAMNRLQKEPLSKEHADAMLALEKVVLELHNAAEDKDQEDVMELFVDYKKTLKPIKIIFRNSAGVEVVKRPTASFAIPKAVPEAEKKSKGH